VDEKVLHAAFIPFGDIMDIQIPIDYETEKHRGFAFVEFESAEDAAAAIDNMVRIWRLDGTHDAWPTSSYMSGALDFVRLC
jgi:RNA recognition motif-containing protein